MKQRFSKEAYAEISKEIAELNEQFMLYNTSVGPAPKANKAALTLLSNSVLKKIESQAFKNFGKKLSFEATVLSNCATIIFNLGTNKKCLKTADMFEKALINIWYYLDREGEEVC